jgi:hypothetical protein
METHMSTTSIGRGPAHGSNENHDGDPTHTTLGEGASQDDAPAGSEAEGVLPEMPVGMPGARARPGSVKGPQGAPEGPHKG